jgi:hypothetical protein
MCGPYELVQTTPSCLEQFESVLPCRRGEEKGLVALYDPVGLFLCDARVVRRVLPVIIVMLGDAAGLLPLFSFPAAESGHHVDAAKAVAGGSEETARIV